jgi:hypothetical protein
VADIVRAQGRQFLERYQSTISYQQLKAYRAVERCRTAALGGHKDKCADCQYEAPISYNSCRSRCCPKCQAQQRKRWLEAQQRDLLSTNYFHVVFTLVARQIAIRCEKGSISLPRVSQVWHPSVGRRRNPSSVARATAQRRSRRGWPITDTLLLADLGRVCCAK